MGVGAEKRQCLSPAFFFVPEKPAKSAGNAVIPTFPAHCPHGLQHLRHKRPTFAFTGESGHTLGFRRKIAHSGSHGEIGAFSLRSQRCLVCQRNRHRKNQLEKVDARQWRVSAFSGTATPLGCVICLQLCDVAVFSLCAQGFPHMQKRGWYHYPRRALRVAETLDARLSKRLICRFPGLVTSSLISAA